MVVRSGFEVQLVDAKTKLPFKEHEKDGKIYVEAEPDAEYFIAIRRIDAPGIPVIQSYFYVDGTSLGYHSNHTKVEMTPSYKGIFSRTNGISKTISLKFSKPKLAKDRDGYRGGMGKVEVKIYEGVFKGMKTHFSDISSDFESAVAGAANAGDGKKKFLLSTKGTTTTGKIEVDKASGVSKPHASYKAGHLIDSIVLFYCSALGMIEVGVLGKPGVGVAESETLTVKVEVKKDPTMSETKVEIIDLCGED